MIVRNIRIHEEGNDISLLADCKIRTIGWDIIYFTFDKKYKDYIYKDASPFAAGLMIPSMHLGQDLVIEGSISKELYEGMRHIMDTILPWPFGLKRIKIKPTVMRADDGQPKGVATFFSGGVDSFYTYLKHQHDKKDPITHFILMKGSDIDLRNRRLLKEAEETTREVAREGGVEVIAVKTNLQTLLEPIVTPDFTHGGALAAVGLCLRNGLKNIYIASSFSYREQISYGSHSDIDKYWSTEQLLFEHDGAEASRFEKIDLQISRSPLALKYLRVCTRNVRGKYNCGRCEKCYRTMTALYALGKLDEAKTFPHSIDHKRLAYVISHCGLIVEGHRENLIQLEKRHIDPELQNAIRKGIAHPTDPSARIKERIIHAMIYLDHMYLRGFLFKIWRHFLYPYDD